MSVLTFYSCILAWYSSKTPNWQVFMSTIVESIWMHWSPGSLTRNEAVFITIIFVQSQAIKCGMCCIWAATVFEKFQNQAGQSSSVPTSISLCWWWGTGMVASSRTFRPHPGRVNRDLFRQLHAVRNGTEALVYSNHPRKTAASSYLAIIFGRIASGIPWFLRSTAVPVQLSHQCRRWCRSW